VHEQTTGSSAGHAAAQVIVREPTSLASMLIAHLLALSLTVSHNCHDVLFALNGGDPDTVITHSTGTQT
jgi:hypothetical protein